jgi:hypothetical protein
MVIFLRGARGFNFDEFKSVELHDQLGNLEPSQHLLEDGGKPRKPIY